MQEDSSTSIPLPTVHNFIDRTGQIFERLTVIRYAGKQSGRHVQWECLCECGKTVTVNSDSLKSGATKSCGCYHRDAARLRKSTHNKTHTPAHNTWCAMRHRCLYPTNPHYTDYGGRGIGICAHWLSIFENFLADMGEPPTKYTIERIDNNKGYWCGHCDECVRLNRAANCKWATRAEQQRNRRANRLLTFNGETRCVTDWAITLGVNYKTLEHRIRKGWTVERALTSPFTQTNRRTPNRDEESFS